MGRQMARAIGLWAVASLLTACVPMMQTSPVVYPPVQTAPPPPAPGAYSGPARLSPELAARNFLAVVARIEPVAERFCRERNPQANCDFLIYVDDRINQPPNAFQSLDPNGRPMLGFTVALIAEARNADEIAFVVGHESAHHVAGHIPQTQRTAMTGAILAGILAQASGAAPEAVRSAQEMGAAMGARTYARNFELEADAIGTEIAYAAGYDPVRGAAFFDRLPDPGDQFLGTHPPNAQRKEAVRRAAATLR